ncbi:nucleoside/nucleotide kinase family protein [Pseudactinotalea sp. Z1732]|uniref:nucleoside/nucleotide kinase family protein n=1 Tax=Micrococcales TaxID=85006 RepID=UPI003C7CB459
MTPPARLTASPGDLGHLVDRIRALCNSGRVLIGVSGPPGAGKSTLTAALARELHAEQVGCAVVGMDGFHLAQAELDRLGRAERKGAPDTFDAHGYLALLRRLRQESTNTVYAPMYLRGAVEQPIGSAVPVHPGDQVILTEGNYLLLDTTPWDQVPGLLDEAWFVRTDDDARRERLLARHLAGGKTRERALAFTDGSDAANAALVATTRDRADVVIDWV